MFENLGIIFIGFGLKKKKQLSEKMSSEKRGSKRHDQA